MRRVVAVLFAAAVAALVPKMAEAAVAIFVDQSAQRMTVHENGRLVGEYRVSTARRGARTPNGSYRPQSMRVRHFSSIYNNAPMPYSIFYSGNYAIHGTTAVRQLGQPASAGCVRLHPNDAREVFALVQRNGMGATTITVTGSTAEAFATASRRPPATPVVATPALPSIFTAAPLLQPVAVAAEPAAIVRPAPRTATRAAARRAGRPAAAPATSAVVVQAAAAVPAADGGSPNWALRSTLQ